MCPAEAFRPVIDAATLLTAFDRPWFIAGGWAIDLFLGRVTRHHDDVDVAVFRQDQRSIRAYLEGWTFDKVVEGRRDPWREGEWLSIPIHEIHVRRAAGAPRAIELLLNESTDEDWVFRRDVRITQPLSETGLRSATGVPFLAPEIVLLYKARDPTAKDDADFGFARKGLSPERGSWLQRALVTCHPGHPWIDLL